MTTDVTTVQVPDQQKPVLTKRELEVLALVAAGTTNAKIGRELGLSEDTIKTHVRRIFEKLGARDRAHAAAIGVRDGLVLHEALDRRG